MQGGLHPAFGGLGSSACSWCPTLASKGRQAAQPGRRMSYQKQEKLKKSGKEVLFLEKLVLREGANDLLAR